MTYILIPPTGGGGGGGAITSVTSTNSISLTNTLGNLTADLRLSGTGASINNSLVSLAILGNGIRAQIPNATITGLFSGISPMSVTAGVVSIQTASATLTGALTSTDWTSFNAKVNPSRSISTTAPLTGGGDLSANRTLSIPQSTGSVDGFLAAADFTSFNAKVNPTRNINTTAPLLGGGNLSADRTLSISQSTTSTDGFLSSVDWNSFNSRVLSTRAINTTSPLQGGGDLSANRTLTIDTASTLVTGALTSTDWNTFNAKVGPARLINTTAPLAGGGNLSADLTLSMPQATNLVAGFLTSTDWNTFNNKQNTITVAALGAGNANGLALTAGSLVLHAATSTQPGALTIATQTIVGLKTFNNNIQRLNEVTNASFVASGTTPSAAYTSAANLLAATCTFTSTINSFQFMIQVASGESILCHASFLSANITAVSDPSNVFLPTNAGVGIAVTKPVSSRVITIRNRTGVAQLIGIQAIAGSFASTTAWA